MLLHILTLLCLCLCLPSTSTLNSDGLCLLALKAAVDVDPTGALRSWSDSSPTPCAWPGVSCTPDDRVTQLALPSKGLTGYIPSELGHLTSLKRLTLAHNNFTRSIPSSLFNDTTSLVVLDLSHNSLTGTLPPSITSLKTLAHLDLSSNWLTGPLPDSFSELAGLAGTLNLSHNRFSGGVPVSLGSLPVAVSLDLRDNELTGKIPLVGSLLNQGPTAFSGNPGLCGFPLRDPCPEAQKGPEVFPSDDPENPKLNPIQTGSLREEKGSGSFALAAVVSGVTVTGVVVFFSVWMLRRRRRLTGGEGKGKVEGGEVVRVGEGQKGRFVVVDEGFGLELEDLLRASAYVVGKSRSGIVYKVVSVGLSAATAVAVRRLSEGDDESSALRFKEFENEVEAIGRLRHPNVVPLRAYYYAIDEKLLITDFIRNGSLHSALHGGGPSNSLPPLPWAARLKIAQGAARGLMYIHEFSGRKYFHGNLKSSKILLDDDFHPYISGFGLARLGLGTIKSTTTLTHKRQNSNQSIGIATSAMGSKLAASSLSYLAPEARMASGKFTQKCDVYSFGIVLLELLTGRVPDFGLENNHKELESFVRKAFREELPLSEIIDPALLPEVNAKKQVIAMFHVALNCTELDAELRPRMRTVSETLDHIKM